MDHPHIIHKPCLPVHCDTMAAAWLCHVARPGGEMSDGELLSFILFIEETMRFQKVSNFYIDFGVNLLINQNRFIKQWFFYGKGSIPTNTPWERVQA